MDKLLENMLKLKEMQDAPIITITKVVDDSTGIWANDEFEFSKHPEYDNYKQDPQAARRLANELRSIADMVEKECYEFCG